MADLEDMMDDVFGMFDDISETAVFKIEGIPIECHPSEVVGAMEAPEGVGRGPKKLRVRLTLAISRTRLARRPGEQSIVVGPDNTSYRVVKVGGDAAGWLLTLATPE